MARLNTVRNYVMKEGVLLEDFETLGDWTVGGDTGGSVSSDTVNYKTGSQSLKITQTDGNKHATKTISFDGSSSGTLGYWIYVSDKTAFYEIKIYLSSSTSLAKSFSYQVVRADVRNGWNYISVAKSEWENNGGESWSNTMVRLRVFMGTLAGTTCSVSFDGLYYGTYARPKVTILFDDGRLSSYTEGFSYMQTKNMPGTVGVNPANVGQPTWATLANLQEMHAAGWDMANHTYTHPHMPTLTLEEQLDEIISVTSWLADNGFDRSRGGKHFLYPYGQYNDDSLEATTLAGMVTARSTLSRNQTTVKGIDNDRLLYSRDLTSTLSLAAAKTYVDSCIENGSTVHFHAHTLAASAGASIWAIADFQELIDYIALKRDAGLLDVVTISQWYDGMTGSRISAVSRQATAMGRISAMERA